MNLECEVLGPQSASDRKLLLISAMGWNVAGKPLRVIGILARGLCTALAASHCGSRTALEAPDVPVAALDASAADGGAPGERGCGDAAAGTADVEWTGRYFGRRWVVRREPMEVPDVYETDRDETEALMLIEASGEHMLAVTLYERPPLNDGNPIILHVSARTCGLRAEVTPTTWLFEACAPCRTDLLSGWSALNSNRVSMEFDIRNSLHPAFPPGIVYVTTEHFEGVRQ